MITIIKGVSLGLHMQRNEFKTLKVFGKYMTDPNGGQYKLSKNAIGNISKHSIVYYIIPPPWEDAPPIYIVSNKAVNDIPIEI